MSNDLTLNLHLLRKTKLQMQLNFSIADGNGAKKSVPLRMCPLARAWDFSRPRSGEEEFSHQ